MPAYAVGRWMFEVDDDDTARVFDNAKLAATHSSVELVLMPPHPSYVRTQSENFELILARVKHLLADRKLPPRYF